MVRYKGDNERPGHDDPPDGVPGRSDTTALLPTIIWTLIALAVLVVMTLLMHRAN